MISSVDLTEEEKDQAYSQNASSIYHDVSMILNHSIDLVDECKIDNPFIASNDCNEVL